MGALPRFNTTRTRLRTFAMAMLTALCTHTAIAFETPKVAAVADDPTGADVGPQFSPDSQRVIFERRPLSGGRAETYEMSIHGGTITPFLKETAPVAQTRLRWSSAANVIAFTGVAADGKASTWLMDGDGTHLRPAYAPSGTNTFYPSWYADAKKLVDLDGDTQSLRVVSLETGNVEPLTMSPALLTGMASVSPDGDTIAVAAQKNQGQHYNQTNNQIWLIDAKGHARTLEDTPKEGRAPTWSPDGTRVVFESNRGSPVALWYAVFVANRDGTHVQQLTPFDWNAQHPVWSPDGRWIAFSARQIKATGLGPGITVIAAPTLEH